MGREDGSASPARGQEERTAGTSGLVGIEVECARIGRSAYLDGCVDEVADEDRAVSGAEPDDFGSQPIGPLERYGEPQRLAGVSIRRLRALWLRTRTNHTK